MNDNGDNIVTFPERTSYDDLVITIVQDKSRGHVGIVVAGFKSLEDAKAFLEDEE